MKEKIRNRTITYVLTVLLIVALTGCGEVGQESDVPYFHTSLRGGTDTQGAKPTGTEDEQAANEEQSDLYLIVEINQIEESLRLYRYANGMEYRHYYGTGTRFYDRYGNRSTVMDFAVGAVIAIGGADSEGILREARISDAAWTYDNISRFSVEEERHVFEIADSRYQYDDSTYVFSNDARVQMSDVAAGDTLSVVGIGKRILSVRVTTGQGTLSLVNTGLFEGSFLQLGTRVFAEITPDMQLTVEEGTYNLTVANNGWGGSREVTVKRGENVTVDLDELKGKGPKKGKIQFVVDVTGAAIVVDGRTLDYEKPVKLTYGKHDLAVYANGYDAWERNLYVNSKEATISISLEDDRKKKEEEAKARKKEEDSQKSSESKKKNESQKRQDELDLIKDLITTSALVNSF